MSSAANPGRSALRLGLAVLILAVAAWVGRTQWLKRQLIVEENRAVELQNQGQYTPAATAYAALLPRLQGEAAARVRGNLAACYAALAADPALPAAAAFELYRQAYGLDPAAVTNPAILKRLQDAP